MVDKFYYKLLSIYEFWFEFVCCKYNVVFCESMCYKFIRLGFFNFLCLKFMR